MTPTTIAAAEPASRSVLVEAAVTLLVCALVAAAYGLTQDRIAYGDGYPYDAASYMQMAKEVTANQVMAAEKPFVYRVGLPYLVGRFFAADPLDGFRLLNLAFGAATLCVLYALLRYFTTNRTVIAAVLLVFVANPNGPFRFAYFYPALTDGPALLVILSILYINMRWDRPSLAKALATSALTLAGVLFREIVLIAPCALLCAACFNRAFGGRENREDCRHAIPFSIAPVATGLLGIYLSHKLVQPIGTYTFLNHATSALSRNISNPSIYVLSVFTSYGPLMLLMIIQWRTVFWEGLRDRPERAAFLGLILIIAVIGGYHTDRFMYWAFPVIVPLQALAIERLFRLRASVYSAALIGSIVVTQLLAYRALGTLPNADFDALSDPGHPPWMIFAPYGDGINFAQIYAAYMGFRSRMILSAEYVALAGWICFLWWRGNLHARTQ